MKMLYILNVANRVNNFCMSSLMAAKELNIEYHIAGNWNYRDDTEREADEQKYGIRIYQVDFVRSPISSKNITAYKQLKEIVMHEKFEVIHCNTPVGGVLGRIVGRKCGTPKVIYQAHGFHFYKGAPKKNWMLYYPIEKWLAHYTDALITINQEDYEAAQKFKLRNNGKVLYVPGVGIDLSQCQNVDADAGRRKRLELGLSASDMVLISVGRLDVNKNNSTLVKAIAKCNNASVHLVICGDGKEKDELEKLASGLGVTSQVHLLGNRSDMTELYAMADVFVMASYREGLSRSIMEAMASGLPCIVSDIRGNRDLIQNGNGGYLLNPNDAESFAKKIKVLTENVGIRMKMRDANRERVKLFSVSTVSKKIEAIYKDILN